MSDKPWISAREPAIVEAEKGVTYVWCGCGLTQRPPWCDKSHNRPDCTFYPLMWKPEKPGTYALCNCKRTKNPPYCDGSHKDLGDSA